MSRLGVLGGMNRVGNLLSLRPSIGGFPDYRPFGPDGYRIGFRDLEAKLEVTSVIVTWATMQDNEDWLHASIAHPDRMPSYEEMFALHRAVFGQQYAFQVFVGGDKHVNGHPYALHLWGRLDGTNPLPDFGAYGTI